MAICIVDTKIGIQLMKNDCINIKNNISYSTYNGKANFALKFTFDIVEIGIIILFVF